MASLFLHPAAAHQSFVNNTLTVSHLSSYSPISVTFLFTYRFHDSLLPLNYPCSNRTFIPLIASFRCRSTGSVTSPPPPDQPESSNTENTKLSTGLGASLSRSQETARIFFAVFFWMSLFFWVCAWDGRNNNGLKK